MTITYPDWFRVYADRFFEKHLLPLAGQPGLRFLQIGAFTGDASLWLLDNVLTGDDSILIDVDTWEGSDEAIHGTFDWTDVQRVYDTRTREAQNSGRLVKFEGSSYRFYRESDDVFDFFYIDGDHTACGVLEDAVRSFSHLKDGGLIAFDDYLWESGKGDRNNPALAINAFHTVYRGRLEQVDIGQQMWFRKIR